MTTFCNSGVFTEEPVTSEWELMICQIINHEAMNIKFRSDYQIIMMNDCGWESVDCGRSIEYYVPIKIYQHTKWVEIRERESERRKTSICFPSVNTALEGRGN